MCQFNTAISSGEGAGRDVTSGHRDFDSAPKFVAALQQEAGLAGLPLEEYLQHVRTRPPAGVSLGGPEAGYDV